MKITNNQIKNIIFGGAIFSILIGFVWFFRAEKIENVEAQNQNDNNEWTCSIVVPQGLPLQKASEILDGVFKQYVRAAGYLESAISSGQLAAGALSQHKDVCDFSKCLADPDNIAPDFVLGIKPLLFMDFIKFDGLALRPPICAKKDCLGDPCSLEVLNKTIKDMKVIQESLKDSYENISKIFTEKTEVVSYDLAKTPEEAKAARKITKKEYVEQSIEWAQEELKECGLTSAERELVAQGKLPNRTKLLCLEALSAGYYTKPKPWSEYCETECLAGLTEECNACLRKCEGTSFLAKLNCEIYLLANDPTCQAGGINCCGVECSSGFNASCENCLCKDPITQKPLSQEKCLMKVCAGSLENYMCCYK